MSASIDEHSGHGHDYHLVDPSPWPALGAFAAFLLTFGVVLFMHPDMLGEGPEPMISSFGVFIFVPGFLLVLYTMFVWWRDVIREAEVEGLIRLSCNLACATVWRSSSAPRLCSSSPSSGHSSDQACSQRIPLRPRGVSGRPRCRDLPDIWPTAHEYADLAAFGLHGDVGAPCAP